MVTRQSQDESLMNEMRTSSEEPLPVGGEEMEESHSQEALSDRDEVSEAKEETHEKTHAAKSLICRPAARKVISALESFGVDLPSFSRESSFMTRSKSKQ